jgi:hypothetical protein
MRLGVLIALALMLGGSALVATTASAGKAGRGDPVVDLVISDCAKDNDLDIEYPLRALRRALDELPRYIRRNTRCERVIERAIDRARLRLDRQVFRIWADCGRDDEIDRDYSVQALRRALRWLPDDLRDYTGCERAIERELDRTLRRLAREVDRIVRRCENDRDLDDRDYSLDALFRALRRVQGDRRCERAITRAIKRA